MFAAAAAAEETTATTEAPGGGGDKQQVVLAKLLAMTFLGVSSFLVGSTPVCVFERLGIRRRSRGAANAVLRLILNFGGGVLLCTTFLHLLPEVREGVEELKEHGTLGPLADGAASEVLAELIMCAGFFLMYSIEELVHGFAGGECHAHSGDDHDDDYDDDDDDRKHHRHERHQQKHNGNVCGGDGDGSAAAGQSNLAYDGAKGEGAACAGRVANYNSCTSVVEIAADKKPAASRPPHEPSAGAASVLRGFLVVGALSIHELFEGLAVGLEDSPKQVWSLAVAVACHKLVIAFYVGLQMLSDRTKPLLAHCSILVFAATSPVGIGVGTLLSNLDETDTVVVCSVGLQGLATGTLMYVVFFEVLRPSAARAGVKQRVLRLLFIALGFSAMLSIQLVLSEGESSSSSSSSSGSSD